MGKRIEDLDQTHAQTAHTETSPDLRDQPWYQFVGTIDDLVATGQYDWAVDSLTGIRETVVQSRRVSEGQRRAVTNIEASTRRPGRGAGRRRYEGFRR
jgi:hypothetical protein